MVGLPGLKLGWMHVGGPEALRDEALARLELVADTYLPVNMPVQLALPGLLAHALPLPDGAARPGEGEPAAAAGGPPGERPLGTWYRLTAGGAPCCAFPWSLARRPRAWRCWTRGWRYNRGYFYDLTGGAFLVLSLLPPPDVFAAALEPLVRVLATSG